MYKNYFLLITFCATTLTAMEPSVRSGEQELPIEASVRLADSRFMSLINNPVRQRIGFAIYMHTRWNYHGRDIADIRNDCHGMNIEDVRPVGIVSLSSGFLGVFKAKENKDEDLLLLMKEIVQPLRDFRTVVLCLKGKVKDISVKRVSEGHLKITSSVQKPNGTFEEFDYGMTDQAEAGRFIERVPSQSHVGSFWWYRHSLLRK